MRKTTNRPKRDRLKQLRAFCQVARLGTFSRAAEYLALSQPAVSMQVRTLEEDLRVLLFERHGARGVALSHIGRRLYHFAMPLVEGLDRLPHTIVEAHYDMVVGELDVGVGEVSAAFLLPRYLKQFRRRNAQVRINVRTGSGRQRLDWLRGHELDIVVAAVDRPPSDLEFHPLIESEYVLITPEDHPLAGRESVALPETAPFPFVRHSCPYYVRQAAELIPALHGVTVTPKAAVEVDGWRVIVHYVAAGVGISIVPDICLTSDDRVRTIQITDGRIPTRQYGAITHRDRFLSLAASRFLEIMVASSQRRRRMGPDDE